MTITITMTTTINTRCWRCGRTRTRVLSPWSPTWSYGWRRPCLCRPAEVTQTAPTGTF
jgi:hypothetical protein